MNRQAFQQRVEQAALSLWELGDLLGIHPHHLHTGDVPGLTALPAQVIIDLARRLDLHPADLIEALDPPTPARSNTAADSTADTAQPDLNTDALTVLTALATTSIPLTADELATVLRWTLDRITTALSHAHAHPALAGPVALRRVPPDGWAVSARLDVLTDDQRRALADNVRYRAPLTDDEANTLLAAYVLHGHGEYDSWRQDHLDAEQAFKDGGLLHSQNGPHRVSLDDDVRFSLDHRPSAPADTHAPQDGFRAARHPASPPERSD
ncbi:hypothetical protein ACQPYK_24950 [Streptosporangium sp. CA-135522]|uniref:hypothetical protein n=1 Tax=Streptosporangium sp. CA-135522 TaxID=3240072 RepID=UPI003D8BAFC5